MSMTNLIEAHVAAVTAVQAMTKRTGVQVPAMTAVQAMRAVLHTLALPKTFSRALVMAASGPAEPTDGIKPPELKAFCTAFDVVFMEPSGWLNLAARVSLGALAQVRISFFGNRGTSLTSVHAFSRAVGLIEGGIEQWKHQK
jgi:hypothetical protein